MSKLLPANFSRLWKSKLFWLEVLSMFGFGVYATVSRYILMKKPDFPYGMEETLHSMTILMPVLAAVFTAMFIGSEYSFGTIRNKLTMGCTRGAVYLSNLIVCTVSQLIVYFVYMVPIAAVGFPLTRDSLHIPADELVKLTLMGAAAMIAVCAVLTLMSMLITFRSRAVVAEMLLMLVLVMAVGNIGSSLNEPEYYAGYELNEETKQVEYQENIKNQFYIGGTKRVIFEFLYTFLPSGQLMQVNEQDVKEYSVMLLYDLVIIAAATGAGLVVFARKDLK